MSFVPRHVGVVAQFTRFLVVGASNTAVSLVAYTVLIWLDLVYAVAGAIAFTLGAANGYVLNRRWTFSARDTRERRAKYVVVQLAGLGVTTLLLWLFVSVGDVDRIVAYALTVPIVTVATFVASRGWVFRSRSRGTSALAPRARPRGGRRAR